MSARAPGRHMYAQVTRSCLGNCVVAGLVLPLLVVPCRLPPPLDLELDRHYVTPQSGPGGILVVNVATLI